jgi:hypothetical protein
MSNHEMLGIVPAAGEGSRWGGHFKELLPTGINEFIIDNTIDGMSKAGATDIMVVTNESKISTHVQHFKKEKYNDLNISYIVQKYKKDIWGAIETTLPYNRAYNFFGMPDTLYTPMFGGMWSLMANNDCDFVIGTFTTLVPARCGVIIDNKVINKSTDLPTGKLYTAWGTLGWTGRVAQWFMEMSKEGKINTYTEAINLAMREFYFRTITMGYGDYTDFASFEDYQAYINSKK